MTRVTSFEECSQLNSATFLREEPLLCECEDETLSPAQQKWLERQRRIRSTLSNMFRCLVEAGAKVAHWDLVCGETMQVFLWDELDNNSLKNVHPSLPKLLNNQITSENMHVPFTPPWSNLIDAAIQFASTNPLRTETQQISSELIVPEGNVPVRHTTNSWMREVDDGDGVHLAPSDGCIISMQSSVSKTVSEENTWTFCDMESATPTSPREMINNSNQHSAITGEKSMRSKKYDADTRRKQRADSRVLDLRIGKRSAMKIVDRDTLKQMISSGGAPLLQTRMSRLLPIAPRPHTAAGYCSNLRVLQIVPVMKWQNTQKAAVTTTSDAPVEESNGNSEEISRLQTTSRCSTSGLETDKSVDLDSCDKREHNFKFLGVEKIYPSLAVIVRPQLRTKERTRSLKLQEKIALSNAVNSLVSDKSKLMEWLIHKKLVPSSQVCETEHHIAGRGYAGKIFLRLAKCSDTTRFPHSGGYIWFCELCQPSHVVPVIRGSIFEAACGSPPGELLQLILHWASVSCLHTFKEEMEKRAEEGERLRVFYKLLRAVCTATLQQQVQIGGENRRIEIGIVSLGTVGHQHTERQVKVEILGVMDVEHKQVRLLSVKPLQEGEKNSKARFGEILEPLPRWLHKRSRIVTDYSVDADSLRKMGYENIHQVPCNSEMSDSNINIMKYLKNVIPVIFQHTLPLLSQPMIQQFLDELAWREQWGWHPNLAYNSILQHIAVLTQLYSGRNFVKSLKEIAANPFKEWIVVDSLEITRENLNPQIQPSVLETVSGTSEKSQALSNTMSTRPLLSSRRAANFVQITPKILEHESCKSSGKSPLLLESSTSSTVKTNSAVLKRTCSTLTNGSSTNYVSKIFKRRPLLESSILKQKCIECNMLIYEGHFTSSTRKCPRCKFSSHCRSASGLHLANAHRRDLEVQMDQVRRTRRGEVRMGRSLIGDPRNRTVMSTSGHCLCGFQSENGDQLAEHLVMCTFSTIYISDLPAGMKKDEGKCMENVTSASKLNINYGTPFKN